VDSVVALWDLAPDQWAEVGWSWPAVDRHGCMFIGRRVGTLPDGGGRFESEWVFLCLGSGGRFTRWEFFAIEDLDDALARFAR
jgi:hypothetical protein